MPFSHYAKIKRILSDKTGWYVLRIKKPTSAKTFSGETRQFDHYYRIMDINNNPIPFCKFQQIDRFTKIMGLNTEDLVVIDSPQQTKHV